jgi:hypothetical protein
MPLAQGKYLIRIMRIGKRPTEFQKILRFLEKTQTEINKLKIAA